MFKQYLPEGVNLDTSRVTQVNVRSGQPWRFYYEDGTTHLTDSQSDKIALVELFQDWDIETEWGGELEIYTRPQ